MPQKTSQTSTLFLSIGVFTKATDLKTLSQLLVVTRVRIAFEGKVVLQECHCLRPAKEIQFCVLKVSEVASTHLASEDVQQLFLSG